MQGRRQSSPPASVCFASLRLWYSRKKKVFCATAVNIRFIYPPIYPCSACRMTRSRTAVRSTTKYNSSKSTVVLYDSCGNQIRSQRDKRAEMRNLLSRCYYKSMSVQYKVINDLEVFSYSCILEC